MGISGDISLEETIVELQNTVTALNEVNATLEDIDTSTTVVGSLVTAGNGLLSTLNGLDFASQTTLALVKSGIDGIDTLLTSIDGKDFSTEATQLSIKTQIDKLAFIGDRLKVDATFAESLAISSVKSSIAQTTTSVLLVAANSDRKDVTIENAVDPLDEAKFNEILYITFVSPATSATPIKLRPGDVYEIDHTEEAIYGVWATGTGSTAEINESSKV